MLSLNGFSLACQQKFCRENILLYIPVGISWLSKKSHKDKVNS